jgi:hypothetical protein
LDAGYDGLAIYLEHRFAYNSVPWLQTSRGVDDGLLTPAIVKTLRLEFPSLDLIPMVNLLGHLEGFFGTEGGQWIAEERFKGLSGCPSRPGFADFCKGIVDDVLEAFDSPWIHIGGDETQQLGRCPECSARVQAEGKAGLYLEHFLPLLDQVQNAGRRPCIWADMALQEDEILQGLPSDTLLFDWQYFQDPLPSAQRLTEAGFEVVLCPTLQTYSAPWMHLEPSVKNVRDAFHAAESVHAVGTCLTTWEAGLFGSYQTMLPVITACIEPDNALETLVGGTSWESEWNRLMGIELAACGGPFAYSDHRSSLKSRFMLQGNPFLLWLREKDAILSDGGREAFRIAEAAVGAASTPSHKGVSVFVASAVRFVELAEKARLAYAEGKPGEAAVALMPMRPLLDGLHSTARASMLNFGGSRADMERCRIAREHVEKVLRRLKEYGDGSLGYLPAFEALTALQFVPYDQANWWRVNSWAND